MTKEEIKKDFLAYADDDSDVLFESNGDVMYFKNGTEQICRIKTNNEGNSIVEYQGEVLAYRTFIAKHLAKLDLFARKIIEKRKGLDEFVDSPGILQTGHYSIDGNALGLLQKECDEFLEFGSKINFITADAGHGKSVLLKQFQALQAERYIKGESNYLFWHVDLQGRDLVRLGEAIMYDLGELRLPGLYYPSIINLIQKRFMILAIDGFDELAAEIGGVKAVSSLSSFVNEMAGQGTLIAASRRTFFDTHDYIKRTTLLKNKVPYDINFNELKLQNWTKKEVISYFSNLAFDEPEKIYDAILSEVHEENHPVLTRPFLLAKIATAVEGDLNKVTEFFSCKCSSNESVSYIVESFTKREVDKWKGVDNKTGQPYLTFEQHIQLLATIAKEMWDAQKDFITIEEIEIYTVLLFDEWNIEEDLRQIIVRIVGSHAFLIPVNDSKMNARKFDHVEFKNYFLARALAGLINESINTGNISKLKRFLYIEQLPDSVAMYCFNYIIDLNKNIQKLIEYFKAMIDSEWKPTYLQLNIGTLFPFMIDKIDFKTPIYFDSKVNYSSLIFENKKLCNITFENGTFINISLRDTILDNVHFKKCDFNEIRIESASRVLFRDVSILDSNVTSIVLLRDGEVIEVAYSPHRINELLTINGIKLIDGNTIIDSDITAIEKSEFKKTLSKFILKFNKMTIQYEKNIINEKYLGNNIHLLLEEIIPLCIDYKIIEVIETKQSKQSSTTAWRLTVDMEDLFKHDGIEGNHPLTKFWRGVNEK
ncbi:MAG TPA: hypothetical protein DCR40_12695 [Prolixibacteraceae bacterium]|nr:hypothetical protein [Prolixibacteraceae bacterium]